MKALSHRRHRDGLALGNQQRGFPPTVDEIHPAHNEEEADKTDEYGACGKGISQGKNHAVRSGLAYAGIRHSSIFCMRKTLILYCINLLRYCPDPGPAGDMPAIRGASGLSPLSSVLKRFPVVPVSPPLPGARMMASRTGNARPVSCGNSTFPQGRFNNLSTGALCLCNVLFSDMFSPLETKRFRLRFSPSFSA